MPALLSTIGLVTDVAAVLILITLSHIEAGMPFRVVGFESPWGSFKTRMRLMWKDHPWMFWINIACVLALFVGTGLMVSGIWMAQCRLTN